tara:strand:- start:5471 stop:5632 length:162 start_codon:yes stop_codon:yes gene_type:complete
MSEPKDPSKKHFHISMVKSVVRIGAGFALCFGQLILSGALFIVAEILGILEEF